MTRRRGMPGLPRRTEDDPPPPRANECAQRDAELILRAVMLDRPTLQALVEKRLVPWTTARRAIWHLTGADLGPTPLWDAWAADERPAVPGVPSVQWRGEPS